MNNPFVRIFIIKDKKYTSIPLKIMCQCPLMEDWIKKIWHIYSKEYYSVIRKNETLPFATTQMGLENIMLSEITH